MNDVKDFLEHYGVPGMRWNHRKAKVPKTNYESQMARQKMLFLGRNFSSRFMNLVGSKIISAPTPRAAGGVALGSAVGSKAAKPGFVYTSKQRALEFIEKSKLFKTHVSKIKAL